MPKSSPRTYSKHSQAAVALLGELIRAARIERKIPAQELADRIGISRGLLQRIEKGDMKCEIGAAFEAADILGVALFDADERTLDNYARQARARLALLPKAARRPARKIDDEF
ncbi:MULTISPECIES: helix-turn-helix transcriptional regulator [unclassified Microbulbifer]|uniref:helix-turn-helix transcriptional regulator n=1 Tax=unclassified Microbulbifer TaxID=2619833 RepID=UPI0027E4E11E|nr:MULTISPECIES: helix-turn-helix transcriptional regulator [unclassified Microbulbifer]